MIGLLFFLSLLGYAVFFHGFFRVEAGKSLFYAFGAMLLLAVPALQAARAKSLRAGLAVYRAYLCPSTLIFALVVLIGAVMAHGTVYYHNYDEYSFWSRTVRELYVFKSSRASQNTMGEFPGYWQASSHPPTLRCLPS